MADFIVEGHFERHIRRMRSIYHERQVLLVSLARERLGGLLDVRPAEIGMTVVGWLGGGLDRCHDDPRCRACGVVRAAASLAAAVRPIAPALLLGYAGVRDNEIREGVNRLAIVLEQLARSRVPSEPARPQLLLSRGPSLARTALFAVIRCGENQNSTPRAAALPVPHDQFSGRCRYQLCLLATS